MQSVETTDIENIKKSDTHSVAHETTEYYEKVNNIKELDDHCSVKLECQTKTILYF